LIKELFAIITSIVVLLGLLSSTAAGVWWVSKLENRITKVEDTKAWMERIEFQQDVNTTRWERHFQLWGDAIETQTQELQLPPASPPPPPRHRTNNNNNEDDLHDNF
jgi:hypothetical protein